MKAPWRAGRAAVLLAAAMLASVLAAGGASGGPCDPGLLGSEQSGLAYRQREGRCEGIYKLEVNSEQIRLVSVIEGSESFDSSKSELNFAWSAPPELRAAPVALRASSLRPRTYYRMDAALPAAAGNFAWPLDIFERVGLGGGELGARATTAHPRPPHPDFEQVFLPLRLWQEAPAPRRPGVLVGFVPEVKLEEVFVTVIAVDLDGHPREAPLVESRPLDFGYYPAKTPVLFEIPGFETAGFGRTGYYQVDLMIEAAAGGAMSYRFVLYHEEGKS